MLYCMVYWAPMRQLLDEVLLNHYDDGVVAMMLHPSVHLPPSRRCTEGTGLACPCLTASGSGVEVVEPETAACREGTVTHCSE